ncbi:hypothetical protein KC887_01875 [Candidatus Kaiserbacteria bacterium]|nr:hypothetical protein [Candidatus Kaiserbacteria bacterium]
MNNIKDTLLQKIKTGEVTMTPRWHFMLRGVLFAATTIIVALLAVYFLSFILYMLRESGLVFAPTFGWAGIVLFVSSSPWILIAVVGVFLITLYVLVSHYSFSYKKPLVYSMIGIVLFVIAVSSLIEQTNLHDHTRDFVQHHALPGLTPLYEKIEHHAPRDVSRGTITELTEDGFMLQERFENDVLHVTITATTKLPPGHPLAVDDTVLVFGPERENTIEAFGVRLDDGSPPRDAMPPPPLQ